MKQMKNRYRVKYSVGIRWISNGCEKRVGDVNASYIPSIAIDYTQCIAVYGQTVDPRFVVFFYDYCCCSDDSSFVDRPSLRIRVS